jgi:predicted molibdopterin-dependent oxidoreductase YjgC
VADGSISRNLHWSAVTCPRPELFLSPGLAGEMNLTNGESITITVDGSEITLPARCSERLEGTVVAATIHFPEVRKLFPWKLGERTGEIELAPIPVTLSRQSEKS